MALVEVTSNDQVCTLDAEHTLASETTDGTYVLLLDTSERTASDTLIVRAYMKVRSGGTSRVVLEQTLSDEPTPEVIFLSDPLPIIHEVVFTIEQTDGVGRTIPWSVVRV